MKGLPTANPKFRISGPAPDTLCRFDFGTKQRRKTFQSAGEQRSLDAIVSKARRLFGKRIDIILRIGIFYYGAYAQCHFQTKQLKAWAKIDDIWIAAYPCSEEAGKRTMRGLRNT